VASDTSSSVSGTSHATIAPQQGAGGRASALPVRDTAAATVITAEIPAVRAGPSYGVLLPDGTVWYPGSRKRLPAPLILRVAVWVLAFAVFLGATGDFVVRYHPSWVAVLRHIVPAQSAAAGSTRTTTPGGGTGPKSAGVISVIKTPAGLPVNTTAYRVNQPEFTVVIKASTSAVFVSAQVMANGKPVGPAQKETVQMGSHFPSIMVQAGHQLSFEVFHTGATIQLWVGIKPIGIVPTPSHAPWYVVLEPNGH
jgi:hypothetical protein